MKKFVSLLVLSGLLSACTLNAPNQAKIISNHRATIITQNKLSHITQAVVMSAGLTQDSCLADFDRCTERVNSTLIGDVVDLGKPSQKTMLLVLSELNYAYAKHLYATTNCQGANARLPLNPNYPNAYSQKSDDDKLIEQQLVAECRAAHRTALYHALRYSYANLFFEKLTNHPSKTYAPFVDEQNIKAQDLYNVTTAELIDELYTQKGAFFDAIHDNTPISQLKTSAEPMLRLASVRTKDKAGDNTLTVYIANDPYFSEHLKNNHHEQPLSELKSIYKQELDHLGLISVRTGIGVGYVGSLSNRHTNTVKKFAKNRLNTEVSFVDNDPAQRIFEMSHLALTGVIVPKGNTLEEVLHTHQFDALFFNPYTSNKITLLGQEFPLYANYSAGYATWLKENEFDKIALANLLVKNGGQLPELYLLEPYNPNKKVIIMLHGLASSPQTWVKLTNNLLADSTLRENYQVWQIFYATNLPILENRHQIYNLINAAFAKYDPNHQQTNSVLLGHSMGGVIGRLLVSDDNLLDDLAKLEKSANQNGKKFVTMYDLRQKMSDEERAIVDERFMLRALPQIDTAIFVSAPHKGTDYADRWFTRGIRKVIGLPMSLSRDVKGVVIDFLDKENDEIQTNKNNEQPPLSALGELYLQNGASQLSNQSVFMQLTNNIKISPTVRYHSIMANNNKVNKNNDQISDLSGEYISDGIVPYDSSHLEGATSETVLSGNHSIHEDPETILHLRKILYESLNDSR